MEWWLHKTSKASHIGGAFPFLEHSMLSHDYVPGVSVRKLDK
ncbi:hypothetical protein CLU80_3501 [Pseudomonas sp. 29]|jgi:hypothetical protein|nr:hypothetical protein CLU80_3501 [Pseudomonas sp. 29]